MMPTSNDQDREKRVIGLYGEMRLAMELHQQGWQVYRAYIDDKFDFVIMKCFCYICQEYTNALQRERRYNGRNAKTVTNLCETCHNDSIRMLVRFIQVKTSEGEPRPVPNEKAFSFHPKIRYHLADGRVFYAWVQVWDEDNVNYFIFRTKDVERFDNITLATYQITDNQKTTLRISKDGIVLNRPRLYDYSVFEDALNNFAIFDELSEDETDWEPPG